MSDALVIAASAIVRAWTWLYTFPLDEELRTARRREIASDLWESRTDASSTETAAARAASIVTRAALGVADDLAWTGEQLPRHRSWARISLGACSAIVALVASTLVGAASGPPLDVARTLRVDVLSSGWTTVSGDADESSLAPALSFTLTNTGSRATGAVQVNAVFYRNAPTHREVGTAFSTAVGWRGLAPGASSRRIALHSNENAHARLRPAATLNLAARVQPTVRLFVQHEGRWTMLGDFPIRAELLDP